MADPIRLVTAAFARVDGDRRPEIGDVISVVLRSPIMIEVEATVVALEIGDDGEEAILVDATGCRWALPIQPLVERSV